jgi:lysophospholipase L1-like esterase
MRATTGKLRIACIGDSLTEGYCERGYKWYPYGAWLPGLLRPHVVFTESFGVSGETTMQIYHRIRETIFKPSHVPWDVAVILAGTNDIGMGIAVSQAVENLTKIADLAHSHGARPFVLSIPSVGDVLHDDDHFETQLRLNAGIKGMCAERNYHFVDLFAQTVKSNGKTLQDKLVDIDGLHFTSKGYRRLAQIVATELKSHMLTKQPGGSTETEMLPGGKDDTAKQPLPCSFV